MNDTQNDDAVSTIVEYISITGIIMVAFIILLLTMNSLFMEGPRDVVSYHSFVDIGNGVSTRVVDLYEISPYVSVIDASIKTKFDIPDEVVRNNYDVEITPPRINEPGSESVIVSRGAIQSTIPLSGIGSTLGAGGETTGAGINVICYNFSGGGCPP